MKWAENQQLTKKSVCLFESSSADRSDDTTAKNIYINQIVCLSRANFHRSNKNSRAWQHEMSFFSLLDRRSSPELQCFTFIFFHFQDVERAARLWLSSVRDVDELSRLVRNKFYVVFTGNVKATSSEREAIFKNIKKWSEGVVRSVNGIR